MVANSIAASMKASITVVTLNASLISLNRFRAKPTRKLLLRPGFELTSPASESKLSSS